MNRNQIIKNRILDRYEQKERTIEEVMDDFDHHMSYLVFILQKELNYTVDKYTNLVKAFDLYDNLESHNQMMKAEQKKASKKKK